MALQSLDQIIQTFDQGVHLTDGPTTSSFTDDAALSNQAEYPSFNLFSKEILLMQGYIRQNNIKLTSAHANNEAPIPILILIIQFFEFVPIEWDDQKVIAWSSECHSFPANLAINLSREPDGSHWWTTRMGEDKNQWIIMDLLEPLRIYGYQIAMGNQKWGPKTYRIDAIDSFDPEQDDEDDQGTFINKDNAEDLITIADNVYFERDEGKWEHTKLVNDKLLNDYPHFENNFDPMDNWASTHALSGCHQLNTKRRYWKFHIYECKENGGCIAMNRIRFLKKFVQ